MPIQVDSSTASQAQVAVTNAFQQRQDQVRDASKRDDDKDKTKTKPAQTAAAQPQPTDTRQANRRESFRTADNQNQSGGSQTTQRGGLVNISV